MRNSKISSSILEEMNGSNRKEVWLTFQELTAKDVLQLRPFLLREPHTITRLNLNGNKIEDEGALIIAGVIPFIPTLVDLNLAGNQISDTGCTALMKSLYGNRNIISLSLLGNMITNNGGMEIAKMLSYNSYLQALYLYLNQIGDEAGLAIAKAVAKNSHLTTLWLDHNPISLKGTEEIVSVISGNRSLLTFELTSYQDPLGPKQNTLVKLMLHNNANWQGIRTNDARELLKRRRAFFIAHFPIPNEIMHKILFTDISGFDEFEKVILGSVLLNRPFLGQIAPKRDENHVNKLKKSLACYSITGNELVRRCETLFRLYSIDPLKFEE